MIYSDKVYNGELSVQLNSLAQNHVYTPKNATSVFCKRIMSEVSGAVHMNLATNPPFMHSATLLTGKQIWLSIADAKGSLEETFRCIGLSYDEAEDSSYLILWAAAHCKEADAVAYYMRKVPISANKIFEIAAAGNGIDVLERDITVKTTNALHEKDKEESDYKIIEGRVEIYELFEKVDRLHNKVVNLAMDLETLPPTTEDMRAAMDWDYSVIETLKNVLK